MFRLRIAEFGLRIEGPAALINPQSEIRIPHSDGNQIRQLEPLPV
jgi:hypothetical protein